MKLQKVIIHLARRRQFFIANVYFLTHRSGYSQTTIMTCHGSIICQKSLASSVGISMHITAPGMIISLQILLAGRITTGWKHTQGLCLAMVLQHEPRGVTKLLESVRRMPRWWMRLWLITSHGKPFQNLDQTTFHCCLPGIRT